MPDSVDWQAVAGFANAAAVVAASGVALVAAKQFRHQRRFDAKFSEAVEALRQARTVFVDIRSPAIFRGETDILNQINERDLHGMDAHYAATLHRLHRHIPFFESVQRSSAAIFVHFGSKAEAELEKLLRIRSEIFAAAVSASGVTYEEDVANFIHRAKCKIWSDYETPDATAREVEGVYDQLAALMSEVVEPPKA